MPSRRIISVADYYKTCAVPKPGSSKKKKLTNGWKNKKERYCRYCGTPYAERHEIFPGANRQISIENRFQVDLCRKCHEEIQHHTNARGLMRDTELKQEAQRDYEQRLINAGIREDAARDMWMALIGRNYL